jgi:CTP synthase (UTP-ammonia lyase)
LRRSEPFRRACVPETSIAIVGDYDPAKDYHVATTAALRHAADAKGVALRAEWIATEDLEGRGVAALVLAHCDAVFLGPGAPYRSGDGACAAVRFAREQGRPFFGT